MSTVSTLCPLCPGAAKIVRRYASHCTNLQTTAHPSDAVVSVRQVAFAGELSIRHKTVRQNSCKWHAQGRRGALCDAMGYCTCITSGNCDARSRALRSNTLWTLHAGHASARTAPSIAVHACATARARDPDAQPSQASSHSVALRNFDLLRTPACAPLRAYASERIMNKTKKHRRLSWVVQRRHHSLVPDDDTVQGTALCIDRGVLAVLH